MYLDIIGEQDKGKTYIKSVIYLIISHKWRRQKEEERGEDFVTYKLSQANAVLNN